ncbi:Alkylmercury lyase [Sphingopyxis sp. LC81]|uniref:Alkylmercury lyase n=5 Tax=Sphingomonadales TaxID=204457 RepID=A0A0S3F5S7_9SPHN|nr:MULTISPECIES: organomercurial lyase MerB [Sphingomonadaceae]MBY0393558.1 organomercurial lyase MerB [Novosphingobium sp.]ALR23103.1 alkylmercury lyase [Sphingobium baderi]EKU72402.1 alkylmercury lyase [Sphingobium yanoikuyae ATCC 51230]KGB53362.1 Alkylmercury lyase [Sphingopyxis sp. LC81]MDT7531247.1 organomercurial lyase MerB [Sphingopyxis sp. SE2]
MSPTTYIEHFPSISRSQDSAELLVALLRELAKGRPVSRTTLAGILNWPDERIAAVLAQTASTEYDDDGNIIGHGLTLRETAHSFEIDGRRLYAWCALDTLMFPALLGCTARVSSRCAATGAPVSLTVSPNEIRAVEPADVAVSLVPPQETNDVRRSFCCHVHFFASTHVAQDWASKRPGLTIIGVREAFCVGQELNRQLLHPPHRATP